MSQAKVELVKRALDAFNRHDLDACEDIYTSDFEGFPSMAGIAESDDYAGREGFETFLVGTRDTWEGFRVRADEVREIGDRVLVLCRIGGRARTSGVQVELLGAMVFEFRGEKISRAHDFLDRSEALRGARLAGRAMSANLDLVRSLFDDWKRGDYSSTDWADPEIEFVVADGPSPGTWTGVPGMIEGYREVMNAWRHYGGEAEEYRVLDEQRVLVLIHLSGRGKVSGLELGQMQPKAAGILEVHDGKVVKLVLYYDRKRALADIGLPD